jgi:hypothetical protein
MEEADLYFVDTRNADVRDHRVLRPGSVTPTRAIVVPPAASRVSWTQPAAFFPSQTTMPAQSPQYIQPPMYAQPVFAQPPIYGQPPMFGQQQPLFGPSPYGQSPYGQPPFLGTLGALFGGVNIGQLVDLIGQGFAAIKALPAAPSSTGDGSTDVANLTLYQKSLAEHAKLDEQIRTGVHIVAKLLGA